MSDFDVLRRIAERGLALSQNEVEVGRLDPRGHLDLWTHLLDEIERAREYYGIEDTENLVTIEVELDDELLFHAAMAAHEQGITLNQYIVNAIKHLIERDAELFGNEGEDDNDAHHDTPPTLD